MEVSFGINSPVVERFSVSMSPGIKAILDIARHSIPVVWVSKERMATLPWEKLSFPKNPFGSFSAVVNGKDFDVAYCNSIRDDEVFVTDSSGLLYNRPDGRPVVSPDPVIQVAYEVLVEGGQSHSFAEMVAFAEPPRSKTTREFWMGRWNFADSDPEMYTKYKKQAEAAGVSTTGKFYLHSLADFPGDPRAWVSDETDAKALCEERNLSCSELGVKSRPVPPRRVPLGDDIIRSHSKMLSLDENFMDQNPNLRKAKPEEWKEATIATFGRRAPVSE